jgi:hypothetical protein
MVALSDAVIVPSPVSVFPERRPMSAEPTAPPTSPRTTLLVKLLPLRRFTSSKVMLEKPMGIGAVGARTTIVSAEMETSLPSICLPGETLTRIASPDLSASIRWHVSACAGAIASIADTPIVIEIPFIQPLRTGETILKSYYSGTAPEGRRGSTPVVARVRQ